MKHVLENQNVSRLYECLQNKLSYVGDLQIYIKNAFKMYE